MFISLRESRTNGFKRWSDLQQQKYAGKRATNVNSAIVFPELDFDVSGMIALARAHRAGSSAVAMRVDSVLAADAAD